MHSVFRVVGKAQRAVVGALAAALLVTGCNYNAGQPGAAVIVGDTRIAVSEVQEQLDAILEKEGEDVRAELAAGRQLDDLSRQIVTLEIRHELLKIAARRAELSVSSAEVSELLYELGGPEYASRGTLWDAEGFREHARDLLLMQKLGREALSSAVTFDYTTAATRTAAMRRAEELVNAGPQRARELIRADVEAGGDAVVSQRVIAGDDPIFAASPAFGVSEGTVVAFQLADTQPWLIAVMRHRAEDVEPSAQAPDPEQIDPALLEVIGLRQLALVADQVDIRVSPRYGVWDPVNLSVAPNEDETGGFVAPLNTTSRE